MSWATSGSGVFAVQVLNILGGVSGTPGINPGGDHFSVALYQVASMTPDKTVSALTATVWGTTGSTGVWNTPGNEVSGTGYTAGGASVIPVGYNAGLTQSTNVVTFTSSGTPSWTGASFTAYGGLVYDTNLTRSPNYSGLCFNYFGGAQTVTSGTFTLTWNASGIATFSS